MSDELPMAEVVVLPGVERRDLGVLLPSEEVLQSAINNGVTSAVIVGLNRSGELYVASAMPDTDKAVGMMMRAVSMLASATVLTAAAETETDGL